MTIFIEYTQKYKELKKICDKIKELDFTNKFEEIKLESSISDFVEKNFNDTLNKFCED